MDITEAIRNALADCNISGIRFICDKEIREEASQDFIKDFSYRW